MGLSASQARLLSLTARISDNELHSQTVANSKVRLADKSQEASKEYIRSLNASKLVYTTYDAKGQQTELALTPSLMYQFSSLKNQYGISNTAGQLLISQFDAMNFENSATRDEFVLKYGVQSVENPDYYTYLKAIYGEQYSAFYDENDPNYWNNFIDTSFANDFWNINGYIHSEVSSITPNSGNSVYNAVYGGNGVQGWQNILDSAFEGADPSGVFGDYIKTLLSYNNSVFPFDTYPDVSNYTITSNVWGEKFDAITSDSYTVIDNEGTGYLANARSILGILMTEPSDWIRYEGALYFDTEGNKFYNTTIGNTHMLDGCVQPNTNIEHRIKEEDIEGYAELGMEIRDSNVLAPADDNDTTTEASPDYEKLLSCYKFVDGEKVLKTFYERIVDLYSLMHDNNYLYYLYTDREKTESEIVREIMNDFKNEIHSFATTIFLSDDYAQAESDWQIQDIPRWQQYLSQWMEDIEEAKQVYVDALNTMPQKMIPDPEDPRTEWYTNLWHRLNGPSENKSADGTGGKYYKVLEDNLYENADWLQFALEHGVVALEQVVYVENADITTGLEHSKWQHTIYSSAVDIVTVEDEVAIQIAEAKYNKTLKEIESKDKKYDMDIKKLDTEHNAMQQEYEALKSVIQKNAERSFKAFS